jgi:hypothetical protein
MPIHDWTRVRANRFHHFHQSWVVEIARHLNKTLPADHFALLERLDRFDGASDVVAYANKANRVTVYQADESAVAAVEIVSPGHKESEHTLLAFVDRCVAMLRKGVRLLVVDLFPPPRTNPATIHDRIWNRIHNDPASTPSDKPFLITSYSTDNGIEAYIESVAVGDSLAEMPLFVAPGRYIPCPLEETYQASWDGFPAVLKPDLEPPPAA